MGRVWSYFGTGMVTRVLGFSSKPNKDVGSGAAETDRPLSGGGDFGFFSGEVFHSGSIYAVLRSDYGAAVGLLWGVSGVGWSNYRCRFSPLLMLMVIVDGFEDGYGSGRIFLFFLFLCFSVLFVFFYSLCGIVAPFKGGCLILLFGVVVFCTRFALIRTTWITRLSGVFYPLMGSGSAFVALWAVFE